MELGSLLPVGITIVVVTIVLAFGIQIVGNVRDDFITYEAACGRNSSGGTAGEILYTACGADYNATVDGISGMEKLTDKLPTIGLVVAAVIIIAILVKGFSGAAD